MENREKMIFTPSAGPTLGVELEVALVDVETMGLSSSIQRVLDRLPKRLHGRVKPGTYAVLSGDQHGSLPDGLRGRGRPAGEDPRGGKSDR